MAAPSSKTVRDLNGNWAVVTQNRQLSDDLSATLTMVSFSPTKKKQGLSWITRKVLTSGGISLAVSQEDVPAAESDTGAAVVRLHQTQTVTPGGFKSEDVYLLDGVEREQNAQAFGALVTDVKFVTIDEARDKELAGKLQSAGTTEVIEEFSSSKKSGWTTLTTWAFEDVDGLRRFTQNSVTVKGEKSAKARLVYDFTE
ncbi:hypothetical protein AAL_02450 [Moelleriella libera RCEF 2490]|uniref:Uncharacterized protein n=1 Tax=Moelleriella libera RCEF 2490 TaxID=1081109 RepID=A0A168EKN6_9HYPO|nr:hypothetical protein AAL_02450 [Moelleriella libera RCEF 2490]